MRRHHACANNLGWLPIPTGRSGMTRSSQRKLWAGEKAAVQDNGGQSVTPLENQEPSMPNTLEAWDLAVPSLTARSRLYSLAPIGIGTAFVESLIGYVERLAEAHAVSAGSLIGRELFGSPVGIKPINVGLVSHAINGVGGGAKRWVQALETVTSRADLRYLTLLP